METLLEATGKTPLLKLGSGVPEGGGAIYAKLERFNPSVSIKDRAVRAMIDKAEAEGRLKPGGTVLEPVAGNTGIALAHICTIRGYRLILTMPEDYMPERRHVLECFGTEVETTPASRGVRGAIERAQQIQGKNPEYFMPDHFSNEAQVQAHRKGLVKEMLEDLQGVTIDAFVGCIGTGSSLTALSEVLRPKGAEVIAVEPDGCPFFSEGKTGSHAIPGIGFGFRPDYLKQELIDRVETVTDQEAVKGCRLLATETGVLAGLSSGASYHVARKVSHALGAGKNILTIFYDGGERYFSLKKTLSQTPSEQSEREGEAPQA